MRALGIDLASQADKTAACLVQVTLDTGRVEVLRLEMGLDDAALLERIRQADATGIDCPLGWPDAFVSLVTAHHDQTPASDAPAWTPARRDELRFRLTDQEVGRRTGRAPLSVSTDLIGVPALRCAGLLAALGVRDRAGADGVWEVYPAAALSVWGLRSRGYKGAQRSALRLELLDELLAARPGLVVAEADRTLCHRHDDAFDALVAALITVEAATGRYHRPTSDQAERARREGWVVVPLAGRASG